MKRQIVYFYLHLDKNKLSDLVVEVSYTCGDKGFKI